MKKNRPTVFAFKMFMELYQNGTSPEKLQELFKLSDVQLDKRLTYVKRKLRTLSCT